MVLTSQPSFPITTRLRIFYHQGECLLINLRLGTPEGEGDEILCEVVTRLAAVTQGAETQVSFMYCKLCLYLFHN